MTEYKVFLNGRFVPESQATISVYDHGFLYGDGVFEGIRAYNGHVFKLKEHVDRLFESAKAIALTMPYSKAEMTELILEACRQNNLRNAYIRPIVARGRGDLGLDPRKCNEPTVVILAREFGALYGDKYERGLKLVTVSTRRNPVQCLSPNIKSLNYLNNILGRIEVNAAGADEGIMLDVHGYVAEATADNIFLVKDRAVVTPPTATSLKGITRQTVVDLARSEGLEVREEMITLFDVYAADEVFITGTAAEIAPCVDVDGRAVGDHRPGPITKRLMAAFHRYAQQPDAGIAIYGEATSSIPVR